MLIFFFKLMVQLKGLTCHAHIVIAHIVTAHFDHRANNYTLKLTVWKHVRGDSTGKIKFSMHILDENGFKFSDLKLKMNENGKVNVDVFSKPTNSYTYVMPSTYYPSNNFNNVLRRIASKLKRICNSDEKFTVSSNEYK